MTGIARFAATADGALDVERLAAWQRDGVVVLEDFLAASDCDRLQDRAAFLVETWQPGEQRTVFSTSDQAHARDRYFLESADRIGFFYEAEAGERPVGQALNKIGHALHDLDPVFDAVSRQPRVAALAASLDIARPLLLQSMYIFKHAGIGGAVDWHQDATFLCTEPASVTGLWFALDDADRDNGCLMAWPGAHRGPLRRRFRRHGDQLEMETLDPSPWPAAMPEPIEVRRGSLVLLHGLLPHGSAANRSRRQRHAYTLHVIDGAAHYASDNWLQRPGLPLRGFA